MCLFPGGASGEKLAREIRSVQERDAFLKSAICQLDAVTGVDDARDRLKSLLPEQAVIETAFGDPDHGLRLGDGLPPQRRTSFVFDETH